MSKVVLEDTASGYALSTVNNNFESIEDELNDKVLYRDNPTGEPNQMENLLDMNSFRIINLPAPESPNDAARLSDIPFDPIPIGTTTALLTTFTPSATIASTNVQAAIEEVVSDNSATAGATQGAGGVGFLYSLGYTGNTVGKWLKDLANSAGSSFIGWIQAGTGAILRTLQSKGREEVSVKDFGAVGDGVVDDAPAINLANTYASSIKAKLKFPEGTYRVVPATAQSGAATYNCAILMLSDMHWVGEGAAVIKVANSYSTDASPKELSILGTSAALTNVSIKGITFDLNGANNLISPSRPTTYNNGFNHAAILVNGPTGRVDDVIIDKCVFKNTAGVCFIVTALVATGTTPVLGKRWIITNNLFLNGGSDCSDHTSVYAWAEDVLCEGNTFWEDSHPHTVGKTGGATCYEVHGSNQRVVNNNFLNYTLGCYVAPNFTNTTVNTIIKGNHFYCSDFGVLLWRGVALGYLEVNGVLIQNNTFYFDNYTYTGQSAYKAAVAYQGQIATAQGAINNIKINDNYAITTGNTLLSQFVRWDTSTTASQLCSNLSITDNQAVGFTDGFYLITNSTNGQGYTEVSRNKFIGFTQDALTNPPHGIYITADAAGPVKTLVLNDNHFIDERGSPQFTNGIFLNTGTITDLYIGPQVYKGVTVPYTDAVTVTNWLSTARAGKATITYSASMTPDASAAPMQVITVTNGTAFTINAPTRPKLGNSFTLQIKNSSGGAMGAITWNAVYARSAWTNPANGQNRSITFVYDGTFWVQTSQTGVDVPN